MSHQHVHQIMDRIRCASQSSPIVVGTSPRPSLLYVGFGDTLESRRMEHMGRGTVVISAGREGEIDYGECKFIGMYTRNDNLPEVERHLRSRVVGVNEE